MKDPSVAVIILNWNGRDYLKDCLDSIQRNTSYSNYNTIVVDNNSEDGSVEMVENQFSQVELIENSRNLGFSIGNNIGIHKADADYYLLLNNDTEPEKGWLTKLVETAEENNAGIVGPKLLYPDRKTIQSAGIKLPELENYRKGEPSGVIEGVSKEEGLLGAAFMIEKSLIEDIGYLDEIFSPADHEESDYCMRAKEAGYSIFLDADSVVIHKEGKSKSPSKFRHFCTRKNTIKFMLLNEDLSGLRDFLLKEPKFILASLISYKNNSPKVILDTYREVLKDLSHIISKRNNRADYIPSYYVEDIKDYSKRY